VSIGECDRISNIEDDYGGHTQTRASVTFSYDTVTNEWRRHDEWDLPFCGQACYDGELEAWVGLRKIHDTHHNPATDGYLCLCDVASPDGGSDVQPDCTLCSERLVDPRAVGHIGASLVYMGDSNYCLVEVMAREGFKTGHCAGIANKCVIRVASFRLKYGKNGKLIIKARRPDRSYLFSKFGKNSKVHAFWM
jgi:hypothetical protein